MAISLIKTLTDRVDYHLGYEHQLAKHPMKK